MISNLDFRDDTQRFALYDGKLQSKSRLETLSRTQTTTFHRVQQYLLIVPETVTPKMASTARLFFKPTQNCGHRNTINSAYSTQTRSFFVRSKNFFFTLRRIVIIRSKSAITFALLAVIFLPTV